MEALADADRASLRRNVYIRLPTTMVSRIGQNGPPIYRNGPRISKRVCEGLVIGSPQNVPRPLRRMKAAFGAGMINILDREVELIFVPLRVATILTAAIG